MLVVFPILAAAVILGLALFLYIISPYDNPWFFKPFVNKYLKEDSRKEIQANGTLFIGSSIIKFWDTLEEDFTGFNPLNRGLAGAKINEINYYADQLVFPHNPDSIVFYAGSNDIQGRKPRTPEDVLKGFIEFTETVWKHNDSIKIYFLSILPSGARTRMKNRDGIDRANRLIKTFCDDTPKLRFIDGRPVLKDDNGSIITEYYKNDRIHLTDAGYRKLKDVIIRELS